MLITLKEEYKLREIEEINQVLTAELPDPNLEPELYARVTRNMLYGPCGAKHLHAPCMNEFCICTKNYPRNFVEETATDFNGYPLYRRHNIGITYTTHNGIVMDNQDVVPYNRYMMYKFNSHINVEVCTNAKAIKYIYMYIYKGYDAATVILTRNEG